jgi:hypothetical protein
LKNCFVVQNPSAGTLKHEIQQKRNQSPVIHKLIPTAVTKVTPVDTHHRLLFALVQIVSQMKVRSDWNDAMERVLGSSKTTVKGHVTFKGQTQRTGEIDLVHQVKSTGSQSSVLIRVPHANHSHWLICFKSEANQPAIGSVWDAHRPPAVRFGVDWAMGLSAHPNQVTDNFHFQFH